MPVEGFISADSHVVEPADLWLTSRDWNKVAPSGRRAAPRARAHWLTHPWTIAILEDGLNTLKI
jgi:hypothetical protein